MRLFRRINAKVIQAEVLIYLSFWFDLYIIKILLVQDMAMKSKISMIMTPDNPFLCLISFNGWRGHAYSSLKYPVHTGPKFPTEHCFCEPYLHSKFLLSRSFVVIVVKFVNCLKKGIVLKLQFFLMHAELHWTYVLIHLFVVYERFLQWNISW